MTQGSVLYVIDHPQINEGVLVAAQSFATEKSLPLAVVHCLEAQDVSQQVIQLQQYVTIETELRQYDIPFMVLLGSRGKVLPWMGGHVKPVRIFTDDDPEESGGVGRHTIPWPGRVMDIAELKQLVQSDKTYCLPD